MATAPATTRPTGIRERGEVPVVLGLADSTVSLLVGFISGLGEEQSTRSLNECLQRVGRAFASSRDPAPDGTPAPFMIWRHDQRAIGELMIVRADDAVRCLGYARFTARLRDDDFRRWFTPLIADIEAAMVDSTPASVRLARVREATQGLLDHLDPRHIRIPR
jgi:hypothetical protein